MAWCVFKIDIFSSKIKELEEELHVVTNNLRSLEIGEEKVRKDCTVKCALF